MMDLKKEKNVFEMRVIEYQNGGAFLQTCGRRSTEVRPLNKPSGRYV